MNIEEKIRRDINNLAEKFIFAFNTGDVDFVNNVLPSRYSVNNEALVERIQDRLNNVPLFGILIRNGIKLSKRNFRKILELPPWEAKNILSYISKEDMKFYLSRLD